MTTAASLSICLSACLPSDLPAFLTSYLHSLSLCLSICLPFHSRWREDRWMQKRSWLKREQVVIRKVSIKRTMHVATATSMDRRPPKIKTIYLPGTWGKWSRPSFALRSGQSIVTLVRSWHLATTNEERDDQGLPSVGEASIQRRVLGEGVTAPDIVVIKDFFRFFATISHRKIKDRMTADSLNTNAEWVFAGFKRLTGTGIYKEDRREVYDVRLNLPLFKSWK